MADAVKIAVNASLNNANEVVEKIRDAMSKGLMSVDEKALRKIAAQTSQAFSLLNEGLVKDARKAAQSINVALLKLYNDINVEAGAASNSIAELVDKLAQAEKTLAKFSRENDPGKRFRERTNRAGEREVVYTKEGLTEKQLKAIGGPGTAGIGRIAGRQLDYGRNWSVPQVASRISKEIIAEQGKAVSERDDKYIGELTKALEAIGFQLAGNKVVVDPKVAEEFNQVKKEYETQKQKLEEIVDEVKKDLKEEQENAETPVITAETGSASIKPVQESTIKAEKNLNEAIEEEGRQIEKTREEERKQRNSAEELASAQLELSQDTKEATKSQQGQNNAVSRAVTTFFGYQMVLRQLRKLWREAIHTITELDKQLTTQAMVTGMTREETWKLLESYQEMAKATGLAQTTIAGVTTEYLRQGESLENALTLTKAAAAAATVAGISASDSVKYLTTAIHGFKLEAEDALDVSDKFAALAAKAATNYEDLAIALSKVASQAALAGMSMDYTLALLTTGLDVTQEAPESIGTALKTVIARMREISDYGKTLEDDVDLNQVESGLRAVGIQLRNGVGELRSTEDVLDELGRKWETLTANQQAAVAKALAGTRQQSRLVAIMENYDKVLTYQEMAMTSIGATTAQQVTYLQGMEASMNKLQSTYQSLINSIISSNEAINTVNIIQGVLEWIGNFLKQPAGRWALLSTLATMLLKSKDLMDRIKATVDKLVSSISNLRKEEQQVVQLREKELQIAKATLSTQAGMKGAVTLGSSRPNGWLSNDSSKSTIADVLVTFGRLAKSLVTPGAGWRAGIASNASDVRSATSSWWRNNSLVGKIRGAVADRRVVKTNKDNTTQELIKAESELQKARQKTVEATDAVAEAEAQAADDDRPESDENLERKRQAEMAAAQQEVDLKEKVAALQGRELVLSSSRLSIAEKIDYLAREQLIAEKEAELDKLNSQGDEVANERKKTEETINQLKNEQARTRESAKQTRTIGEQLGSVMSKVSGAMAAVSTVIAWVQEWTEVFTNYANVLASKALDEAKRIQAEMYQNTQLKSTIASATSTITKLSTQVVKTTEDLEKMSEAQAEFAEAVGLSTEEVKAMTAEQVDNLAQAKQLALDEKNADLARELNETLTKASYDRNGWEIAGNIIGKTTAGAVAGTVAHAGWGTLIGAVAGLVVGVGEEITKAVIAADARNKINALLETDEGVNQFKYALKLNYKQIAQATEEGGKDMANAMSAMFSSIVELFDTDDLKAILEQFNYDMVEFANYFNTLLNNNLDAVKTLSSDESTISQRVKAAQQINAATAENEQLNSAFRKLNYNYLQIGQSLTEAQIELADIQGWTLSNVSAAINAFNGDIQGLQKAFDGLGEWLKNGAEDTEQLAEVVADLSKEEVEAIKTMITGSRTLQDVADTNSRNRDKIASFRETQANWDSMSESDRQRFIDENINFFADETARRKFLNGEDITTELAAYQKQIQEESRKLYEEQRKAALIDLKRAQESGDAKLIAEAQAYLDIIETRLEGVDHMFDLSLQEVVDKQNEQIKKLKEMYQAEEKALTDSLNKRKEAYQKYFSALESQESAADYAQSRDQLIDSISRLSAGTDAASRSKMADLRKQLNELDKQEAQRQREEARQAVLDSIDNQISQIQDQFDKLLSSDQALLDSMNENTYFQYLAYLAQSGQTEEAQQLAIQQMGDLLKGKWGVNGINNFGTTAQEVDAQVSSPYVQDTQVDTSQNTINITNTAGQTESVKLTQQEMQQLITQMFDTINSWRGTSWRVK